MEGLTELMNTMTVNPREALPMSCPFHPPSDTAINLEVPRFLFRVYSAESAGENNTEGFTSKDGSPISGNLTDIFAREPELVAISLNEHLRWSKSRSCPDPFISWTTSLAFAFHYSFYKSKEEGVGFGEIMLCVLDTTCYPPGTFMRDLDLIKIFKDQVPRDRPITVYGSRTTWERMGLGYFLSLRTRPKQQRFYYFGEYLSQGRTGVDRSRSSIVSMDKIVGVDKIVGMGKIVNDDLFRLAPQLWDELESIATGTFGRNRCADAVLEFRQDFYNRRTLSTYLSPGKRNAACRIAYNFSDDFAIAVLVNLLSLRPFWDERTIGTAIWECAPDKVREFCLRPTKVIADDTIPEVQQFQTNIHSVYEACYQEEMKRMRWLFKYIDCHLATERTAPGGHASMFGKRLEDWADKVALDAGDLEKKLEEIKRVTKSPL